MTEALFVDRDLKTRIRMVPDDIPVTYSIKKSKDWITVPYDPDNISDTTMSMSYVVYFLIYLDRPIYMEGR